MSKEKNTVETTQWVQTNKETFMAAGMTIPTLYPGFWRLGINGLGQPWFMKMTTQTDDLLITKNTLEKTIVDQIESFWKMEDIFKNLGYMHRRGIFLHGPPGTGKTSLIHCIVDRTVERDGIVFYCTGEPHATAQCLKQFRSLEPTRPIVCIFEELDSIIDNYGESAILSLLDGEHQIDHCVNIATTNHIKRLDNRIIGRPKRFDVIYEIGYPGADVRQAYFEVKLNKVKTSKAEIAKYVKETAGLSYAALAEVILATKAFGKDLKETVAELAKNQKHEKVNDTW